MYYYTITPDTTNPTHTQVDGVKVRVSWSKKQTPGSVTTLAGLTRLPASPAVQKQVAGLNYQNWCKQGVPVNGITLGATDADQNRFANLLTLYHTAEQAMTSEQVTAYENSNQTIADKDGNPHTFTVAEVKALLVQYGQAIQTQWTKAVARSTPIPVKSMFATNEQYTTVADGIGEESPMSDIWEAV